MNCHDLKIWKDPLTIVVILYYPLLFLFYATYKLWLYDYIPHAWLSYLFYGGTLTYLSLGYILSKKIRNKT
jgi:hypothetical protein